MMPEDAISAPRPRAGLKLAPMSVPKASDVLVEELRERILSGELSEGTALPPERDLVEQTGMSRTTVREALRILEVQGLLRISAGRAGGAFVRRADAASVVSSVGTLIRSRRIRLSGLLEARAAIEPICAQLAATHRTDADLAALDAANTAFANAGGDFSGSLQANVDWHLAVATATHNELIAAFFSALSQPIYQSTDNAAYGTPESRQVTLRAHRSITDAIREGDAAAAVRRMSRHLHLYAATVSAEAMNDDVVVSVDVDSVDSAQGT